MDTNFLKAASAYTNAASFANPITQAKTGDNAGFSDFSGLVNMAMNSAQNSIARSEKISAKALMKDANLSSVVTSVSEAELALQTIVTLRDKMLSAYQDIIKMPI